MTTHEPDPAARRELYEKIQWLVAGHPTDVGIGAVVDSLGALVAFSVKDRDAVRPMLQILAGDMEKHILENWAYVRRIRAAAEAMEASGGTVGHA